MREYISNNLQETNELAKKIIADLQDKRLIALSGNLGAGKTALVKAIAENLGIKEAITSPTFVLLKVYNLNFKNLKKLVHIDCYRLDGEEDLQDLGLEDYIADPEALVLIEWAEKIKNLPEANLLKIKIEILGNKERKIIIS
ncbi:tRNA (adenosine(37)-N6)-threonylcarbamoyltransferase complex ATPase subunit type 1 TsaE [Candidatus Nomurabacteria bacterium]|nr:tRNA (adenosine(37)-N6)-threonylcarbamoyltransferase complex ATPase subunit type 1 TsaE [Candidatus Nomurabacteria bacterium]